MGEMRVSPRVPDAVQDEPSELVFCAKAWGPASPTARAIPLRVGSLYRATQVSCRRPCKRKAKQTDGQAFALRSMRLTFFGTVTN